MASVARSCTVLRFGPYEMDATSGQLRKSGTLLKFHPQPFRVLLLLASQPGEVVTREEIQQCLWNGNTLVDADGGINFCVKQIRAALCDDAEEPKYIETLPRRGYRFIAPVNRERVAETVIPFPAGGRSDGDRKQSNAALQEAPPSSGKTEHRASVSPASTGPRKRIFAGLTLAALSLGAIIVAGIVHFFPRTAGLSEKDTVVLADITNNTGDSVFDGALKQALTAELSQSPFLNLLPEKKISNTLRMMSRPAEERVSGEVAREICVRTGSTALLTGTISKLGTHYLVGLNAVECNSGTLLASVEAEASSKDEVLKALSASATGLRRKLGESLPSVQKYDVPVQATTSSLEALQDFSMAARVGATKGDSASIPFVERALQHDPNFAAAYVALARRYSNLDEPALALENATKAYALRDHVTEPEKLEISATYFRATGDLENLDKTLELWKGDYPRASGPHGRLCVSYGFLGQYEQAVTECRECLRLDPDHMVNYDNLAEIYLDLNRYDESRQTCDQARARNLSCSILYELYFLQSDTAGMAKEVVGAIGKPDSEAELLSAESNTKAYFGKLREARAFSRRATDSALRTGLKEAASLWRVNAALREAEFGEIAEAKQGVREALGIVASRNTKVLGALALARTGEAAQAKELRRELVQSDPSNTLLKVYWLPVIDAAIGLKAGKPANALASLEGAAPYELGRPSPNELGTLYPVFLRGEAYLKEGNGIAAAAEFQKVLDHPGIVVNFVTGALARLGLARAYALQGDTNKAKAAYAEFLTLWKDADPDIPILKEAKAEYAKL